MKLEEFRQRIEPLQLSVTAHNQNKGGEEHWIILGGKSVVQWWPFSRRQTAYCEATRRSYSNCGIKKVLDLTGIDPVSSKVKSQNHPAGRPGKRCRAMTPTPSNQSSNRNETHNLLCPECGKGMVLRTDSKFKSHGFWYACSNWPTCRGTHGAHADGSPLGTPANQETKRWRIRAHSVFDRLWQSHIMSRADAYRFLAQNLEIPLDKCHIGSFSMPQCQKVVEICESHAKKEEKKENSF